MKKIILHIVLILLLAGCNSMGTKQKGEGLVNAMDEYIAALRWGRFDSAIGYHLEKDDTTPEIDSSTLEHIKVTEHKIKKKTISDSHDSATVEMEIQYYHNEYGTLKKISVKQEWWYHEDYKRWFLSSEFPKF